MSGFPTLALRCFGPPLAWVGGKDAPAEVLWRKHLALLIYLALSPGRARSRDHLIGLLWPEKPEKDARHSLNEAIRRLRASLGEERLLSRTDTLALNDDRVEVDALRFLAVVDADPAEAVTLRVGDFLEGFVIDDAAPFEEWASAERRRFQQLTVTALVAAGERHLGGARFADAAESARRALALNPLNEPAVRLIMRATALRGDTAGALAVHREFAERLNDEIGEVPSRDLATLAERIRSSSWKSSSSRRSEAESVLVGREQVHREAFDAVEKGLRGPHALAVTGTPGSGKSRLLSECVARAALEGAAVALARPLSDDGDTPWSTLRLLLHAGLARAPGFMGAAPRSIRILAAIAPELASQENPSREPRDRGEVAVALRDALSAAAEEQPVVIAIDDAQVADAFTLTALRGALDGLRQERVFLALAVLTDSADTSAALLDLRREIGRRIAGGSVRLDALSEDALHALVSQLAPWCTEGDQRRRLARRLAAETGGNPFFAVTLLRGLQRLSTLREGFLVWPPAHGTYDTPLPFTLPDLLGTSVAAQLVELTEQDRRVLSAATVGAPVFDLDLLADLCSLGVPEVEASLANAERRHLVRFDGERYAFTASLIAEVVRHECLTPGQRRSLTRRVITLLEPRGDLASRVLRAELVARSDAGDEAFRLAIVVAREARDVGAGIAQRRAVSAARVAAGGNLSPNQQAQVDELRPR